MTQRHLSASAPVTLNDLDDRLFAYVPEVAQILGLDERTVRSAIRAGQIPATKTGQRYIVRVSWLREQAGHPGAAQAATSGPDLDELADRVADRVFARFARLFGTLAPDTTVAGPVSPGPATTAADLPPATEQGRVHRTRTT